MNFVTNVIMLNLFVLVVLQQYDDFKAKSENPVEKFNEILENFKKAWNHYSSERDKGYRINVDQLSNFLMELECELIPPKLEKKLDQVKKYILDLRLLK